MSTPSDAETAGAARDAARALKYRQAAVLYFAYGVLYLARVMTLGFRSGWEMHGYPRAAAWVLIPVGALITVAFPYFIWRRIRWFTAVLALIVFVRAVYLFVQPNVGFFLGPFIVASVTAWMLARAAWDL